jgi:hypothetical protein
MTPVESVAREIEIAITERTMHHPPETRPRQDGMALAQDRHRRNNSPPYHGPGERCTLPCRTQGGHRLVLPRYAGG